MSKAGWVLLSFRGSERNTRSEVDRTRHNQVGKRQRVRCDIRRGTRRKVRFEVLERTNEALRVIVQRLAGSTSLSQKSARRAVP